MSQNEISQPKISEHTLRPIHKKETAKAWVLTLVLHFLIAGGLIGYWYFYQRPHTEGSNVPLAVSLPAKPIPTSTPASTLTTLSSITTSSVASQTAIPASVASMTGKPLADYLAKQQATPPPGVTLPSNGITPIQIPTTVMQQKVITHDAPIKKALTERDIARNEATKSDTQSTGATNTPKETSTAITQVNERVKVLQQDDKPSHPISATDTPITKGDPTEKEASELSKDIDVNNEKLTQLIDEVKIKNQRQIEADSGIKPTVTDSPAPSKPASTP